MKTNTSNLKRKKLYNERNHKILISFSKTTKIANGKCETLAKGKKRLEEKAVNLRPYSTSDIFSRTKKYAISLSLIFLQQNHPTPCFPVTIIRSDLLWIDLFDLGSMRVWFEHQKKFILPSLLFHPGETISKNYLPRL